MQGKTVKSNTFRLDMQKPMDKAWFKVIPAEEKITTLLGLYGHVIYFPATREVIPVEDMAVRNESLMSVFFSKSEPVERLGLGKWATTKLGIRRRRQLA